MFFFLRLVPFFGVFAWGAMLLVFVTTPFWLAYWTIRFGRITTKDADYARAKTNFLIAVVLWFLMLLVIAIPIVLSVFAVR